MWLSRRVRSEVEIKEAEFREVMEGHIKWGLYLGLREREFMFSLQRLGTTCMQIL